MARLDALKARLASIYELPSDRIGAVQGARGLAIALVFFVHHHTLFGDYARSESLIFAASRFFGIAGHLGVDLFFVLSGALVYGVLLRRQVQYGQFLRRRVRRLYPVFLTVLTVYVILSVVVPSESKIPTGMPQAASYLIANALLLPGLLPIRPIITVSWSLSFEFLFYALLPLVVSMSGMRGWTRVQRVSLIVALSVTFLLVLAPRPSTYLRMAMFLSGMLAYEATSSDWFRARLSPVGELITILAFCASFWVVYLRTQQQIALTSTATAVWTSPVVVVLFVIYFWLLVYLVGFPGRLAKAFAVAPMRWLGNVSYSFYLIHGLTLKALQLFVVTLVPASVPSSIVFWGTLFGGFAAATIAATGLYVIAERPFLTSSTVVRTVAVPVSVVT